MSHPSLHTLLRRLEAITTLPQPEKEAILSLPVRVSNLAADRDIVREGDRPTQCCLLVEGFLCRYKDLSNGKRQIMAFYVPGDIPDLLSLHIDVMDHSLATIVASKIAFIPHDAMCKLINENSRIANAFWRETLIDAAVFREWVVNLGSRDAYSRIAHLLCEVSMRLDAVGLVEDDSFDFPITQAEIADATGLSTVHVNRSIMELRGAGLITLQKNRCTIHDRASLQEAAMFDPTYLHLGSGEVFKTRSVELTARRSQAVRGRGAPNRRA